MVRILPSRLMSSASTANSRSSTPLPSNDTAAVFKDSGLALTAIVLRARNLAAKDRGGTSDPYLVISLGDSRIVTHSVPKTLNPEWNVIETMPVNSVQCLILEAICWDKDRFGKDYMGEFDLALEEIFANGKTAQEPKWYSLKSKKPGKKTGVVSGEVLIQFTLFDSSNTSATQQQVMEKFNQLIQSVPLGTPGVTPAAGASGSDFFGGSNSPPSIPSPDEQEDADVDDEDDDDDDDDDDGSSSSDPSKTESVEKRKRRLRIKLLKKKKRQNPYEFATAGSDVVGIIYLEILNITDLPPESNLTRTSFDMDPFVVASLGKKTFKTPWVRHNLNPVFNDKMVFQVLSHEQSYSFGFTVLDHDKYSGNDFIASCDLSVKDLIDKAPKANPDTGLYDLREPAGHVPVPRSRLRRLTSRSGSTQSLSKLIRPPLSKNASTASTTNNLQPTVTPPEGGNLSPPANPATANLLTPDAAVANASAETTEASADVDDPDFVEYAIPLKMKNLEKWEAKHNPIMYLRAKYMPYPAIRQQFWRSMLRQYDADDSGKISKVELTTMLDTLGSTLRESTIDSFFQRFPHKANIDDDTWDLDMDEAVICLEDQLEASRRPATITEKIKGAVPDVKNLLGAAASDNNNNKDPHSQISSEESNGQSTQVSSSQTSTINVPVLNTPGEEGEILDRDDLAEDRGEEHVVEIRECPICHQPRLNKRKDADIITHIATCASSDWRQVNNLVMGGFVTASQAQRKWYSKIITKISYGGYKLGANSANILVQDRITGQINEEKMSVYVRLGIRLLYKGLKSSNMENKRIRKLLKSLSIKQGKKFDDPASKDEIENFIAFHKLDMSEVLLPVSQFKNFNEFFYRALKPEARPCSGAENPHIIVSPADCRSVVFNTIDQATNIWIKGREFSVKRLLGSAYPDDAKRYDGGALGIFRLAPQDYHRFHIPVDGLMGKPTLIDGEYYTVNPMAIRSALDVYGENVRVVVPIDSPQHGRVMVICVGAMMVGSTVITRKEGEEVKRAEELGYFKFGGSTIVLLFEPGKMKFDDDLVDNSAGALETLLRAGMSIGHTPNVPQWTPDMRKDAHKVTAAEKKEAKRRIQGSVSTEGSPDASGDDVSSAKPSKNVLAASMT